MLYVTVIAVKNMLYSPCGEPSSRSQAADKKALYWISKCMCIDGQNVLQDPFLNIWYRDHHKTPELSKWELSNVRAAGVRFSVSHFYE